MIDLTNTYIEQIQEIFKSYNAQVKRESGLPQGLWKEQLITRCRAMVHRATGPTSPYTAQLSNLQTGAAAVLIPKVLGVVRALEADLRGGYLKTLPELIHGEIFGDFLEMADHLLESGYKDAAAVMVGGTLEAHLRQLCQKFGVETEVADREGTPRPKKADRMNSDLTSASAYRKLDQKNVTAWLDLRNKAAHGKYDDYNSEQIALLSQSVRDFISRNPA